MNPLLKLISQTYYTIPIMVGSQLIAAAVSFNNRKRFSELKFFHFYPIAGISQTLTIVINALFLNGNGRVIEASIGIFSLIEVILIYDFALRVTQITAWKYILKLLLIAFCIFTIISWAFASQFYHSSKIIPYDEVLILIPTCSYFFQLFKSPASCDLQNTPAFWINIGVFFVLSCTFPLSILDYFYPKFVLSNMDFYYINFISYTFLYLLIIKGYLSKTNSDSVASQLQELPFTNKI